MLFISFSFSVFFFYDMKKEGFFVVERVIKKTLLFLLLLLLFWFCFCLMHCLKKTKYNSYLEAVLQIRKILPILLCSMIQKSVIQKKNTRIDFYHYASKIGSYCLQGCFETLCWMLKTFGLEVRHRRHSVLRKKKLCEN